MADYQAKSTDTLSFNLTQDEILIGRLFYKGWFKFAASVELANSSTYQIESKGFWGTTIELKEGDNLLITFSMDWRGQIVLQTNFQDSVKEYLFKHRGVFKESFVLIDQAENELLVMKPDLKWSKLNFDYQVSTSDSFESSYGKELLLMTCLHCANYYMSLIGCM